MDLNGEAIEVETAAKKTPEQCRRTHILEGEEK